MLKTTCSTTGMINRFCFALQPCRIVPSAGCLIKQTQAKVQGKLHLFQLAACSIVRVKCPHQMPYFAALHLSFQLLPVKLSLPLSPPSFPLLYKIGSCLTRQWDLYYFCRHEVHSLSLICSVGSRALFR